MPAARWAWEENDEADTEQQKAQQQVRQTTPQQTQQQAQQLVRLPAVPEIFASWEEYDEADTETVQAVLRASEAHGRFSEVLLRDGAVRCVQEEWFASVRGTPLHIMLFDERWAGGRQLEDCSESFDDVCAFLRGGDLPPEQPRARRRRLARAADFYCLDDLAEALDAAAVAEQAARDRRRGEEAAAAAAERRRLRRARRRRRQQEQGGGSGYGPGSVIDNLDHLSALGTTKAEGVASMLGSLQRLCRDGGGGGPRATRNPQISFRPGQAQV